MTRPVQLPLDLGFPASLAAEDYLLAPCNRAAVDWIGRWPDWPMAAAGVRGLLLRGPDASGKTHLAAVWARQARALWVAGPDAVDRAGRSGAASMAVDGIDGLTRHAETATDLFHLYNQLGERGGFLLATARSPATRWPDALPDLVSRLATLTTVAIGLPDDTMVEGLLIKLFADRQLRPDKAVIAYLARRLDRSFAAVRTAVAAIDAIALGDRRKVTLPLVRRVLDGLQTDRGRDRGVAG